MCQWVKDNSLVAYCTFSDYSKTFDMISRSKLYYILIKILNGHIWLALVNYYEVAKVKIILKGGVLSEEIKSEIGLKQGGPASPGLLSDILDPLLKRMKESGYVIKVKGVYVGIAAYADDMAQRLRPV